MKTDILVVSYLKDKPYLHYCLSSIRKFARGFGGTTVVVPASEASEFSSMLAGFGARMRTYDRDSDSAKWHLHAQSQKHFADDHCPDADFILHTDSDCVFTEPVTPEDYFENGKPVMLFESYLRIPNSPWIKVTSMALKRPVEYEFMRRHPQVNPRGVYRALRDYIARIHGVPFEQHVLSQKPSFPWGWTEHNIIGAFAYYSPEWNQKYYWWEVGKRSAPHEKLAQFWSLAPIDKEQDLPHNPGHRGTPIREFQRPGL